MSRRRRYKIASVGVALTILAAIGVLGLLAVSAGQTTAGSSGSTSTSPTNVNVEVNNMVSVIIARICNETPEECPELRAIFNRLFSIQARVESLEMDQKTLGNNVANLERAFAARLAQLQGQIADLSAQTRRALEQQARQIEEVRANAAADIDRLRNLQLRFQDQTDNRFRALEAEIARVRRDADDRIARLERLALEIQRDADRREAGLRREMEATQRSNDMKIGALNQELLTVKMLMASLDQRVALLERQIPILVQRIDELRGRVMRLENRVADLERALGYLLAHH